MCQFWKKSINNMKTNKALAKRLKITKNGKILARKPGQNHFNAKEKRSGQLAGKKTTAFRLKAKDISRYQVK